MSIYSTIIFLATGGCIVVIFIILIKIDNKKLLSFFSLEILAMCYAKICQWALTSLIFPTIAIYYTHLCGCKTPR